MSKEKMVERFSLGLTEELSKKLNEYCLKVAMKRGRMPHALKTKILRKALEEWLEKHGKDYNAIP